MPDIVTYTFEGNTYDFDNDAFVARNATYPTVDVISAALMAFELNNNEHVKASGRYDDVIIDDPIDGYRYYGRKRVAVGNAVIVRNILTNFRNLLKIKQRQAADIVAQSSIDFAFESLSGDMSEFDTKCYNLILTDYVGRSDLGLAAFIPQFISNREKLRESKEATVGSEYIGNVGDKIEIDFVITRKTENHNYGGYNISGYTPKGDAVSFFTTKDSFNNLDGVVRIKGRIKSLQTVWGDDTTKETRLNYVSLV